MRIRTGWIVRLLAAGAIILVAVMIIGLQVRLNEIREEKEALEAIVEEYSDRVDELQYQLDREIDDEYIEEYARKKFSLYRLDDTVFYFDNRD